MSKKILTSLDLNNLELLNVRIQNLASDPATSLAAGRMHYNSSTNTLKYYNGTQYIDPQARATHTGTQLAATISDFNTAVRTNTLNQMATPTADLVLSGFKITGLGDGVSASDAATYGQLLNLVNGTDWKQSVRAIATTAITLSGTQTVDGVALVAGDRVLVNGQASAPTNGLYVVAAGAWTRATDAATSAQVTAGLSVMVTEGTSFADSQWRLTTNDTIALGTTALSWAQIGAGSSYVQGTGISIVGNTVSIDTAVTARKFSASIGNAVASTFAVTHGLATRDVVVNVYDTATFDSVECDVVRTDTNNVQITFANPIGTNAYRVVVIG
jgi:hypothetical protein